MKNRTIQPKQPSRKPHTNNNQATDQKSTYVKTDGGQIISGDKYVNTNLPGSMGSNPKVNNKQTAVDSNSPYAN
jgi:hypothetical protein